MDHGLEMDERLEALLFLLKLLLLLALKPLLFLEFE